MKKRELLEFNKALQNYNKVSGFVKFSHAVNRNKRLIKDEVESITESIKEYEEKRTEIVIKYAEKDEKGNLVINGDNVKILPKNVEPLNKEIKELNESYKKQLDEFNTILEEDIEIEFYKVDIEYLEGLDITTEELDRIEYMLL